MSHEQLRLFDGFGIEVEYMIVHRETLKVLPVTDWLLKEVSGAYNNEVEMGDLGWSNELVMHVVELKTSGTVPTLGGLHISFMKDIRRINDLLDGIEGMLMPTGMHPLMDPARETVLWKHDNSPIYDRYNAIFNCSGHGWANLQSVHINLPFGSDDEFGRLHAAIRLVLPMIPAIAASSPIVEGRVTGMADSRLEVYRHNQNKIPEIAGDVIPEQVFSRKEYEDVIFRKIFSAIAPHDPEGILRYEWLNSRGCIARFERDAIEIRLMDVQESPVMDLAVISFIVAIIRALVNGEMLSYDEQKKIPTVILKNVMVEAIRDGSRAVMGGGYPELFGYEREKCDAAALLRYLLDQETVAKWIPGEYRGGIDIILEQGTLSERIVRALKGQASQSSIRDVYSGLAECLRVGMAFLP
ncbi:MAG: glutamate--cysteine ligase [Spirochaetae bacterium HGW-Spirochaetae-1]|jgi:gamma-glutamyl:cysteine ligase YbdK (ATP-grasp superfamily)|nr:MAG: glutamate--cysteine ligase [Spirochaetae bacterium HGW-Spirochaetae-1]